jgi:hypothetical protein
MKITKQDLVKIITEELEKVSSIEQPPMEEVTSEEEKDSFYDSLITTMAKKIGPAEFMREFLTYS